MVQYASQYVFAQSNANVNESVFGSIIYNVKAYGAKGNGVSDDTTSIQLTINAAKEDGAVVFFPPGNYRISSSLIISGGAQRLEGSGFYTSRLITTDNIPMITLDVSSVDMYYNSIVQLGFVGVISGTRTSNDAILITGSSTNRLTDCIFSDLMFEGTYTGIHSTKSTNDSGENLFDWNIFTNLRCSNFGANNVEYGIKLDYGSGTGNIYTSSVLKTGTAGIEIGGSGSVNVGDITISNIQFGGDGATSAIKLVGSLSAYRANVTIVSCQFDAGITNSLDFINMTSFTAQGCNWGGATTTSFTNCSNYSIDSKNCINSYYGLKMVDIGMGATVDMFAITLPTALDNGLMVEITTFGFQQGRGSAIVTSRYHVVTDGSSVTAAQIDNYQTGNGGATLTHSAEASGLVLAFKITTNSTSGGSDAQTGIRVVGRAYDFDVL
jgi:hypothetical protein